MISVRTSHTAQRQTKKHHLRPIGLVICGVLAFVVRSVMEQRPGWVAATSKPWVGETVALPAFWGGENLVGVR